MGRDLSNLYISQSFEALVQISGSVLTDGTGSEIGNLTVSTSFADTSTSASYAAIATSASYALTASYAENAAGVPNALVTASVSDATIAFLKGSGATFDLTVNNVVNADSASVAVNATSASYASNASTADSATSASYALTASFAENADPFPYSGDAVISGSLSISGSLNINDGTAIDNATDTYAATDVKHVVTLTQAEYGALTPSPDTLYIISDSVGIDTSVFATTGSNTFVGNQTVSGSITVQSGNQFIGDLFGGVTGNLTGTASLATNAENAANATSASYALTASYAENAAAAVDTGSLLLTASISDDTLTFTKGDASTFNLVVNNVVSASYALTSTSASYAATASIADLALTATEATNATYAQNTITTGKNLEATTIDKGTPLYFTASGTSGNIVGIYRADAGNPARMPAGGIAGESISTGAEGVVLLDGYIGNVNTSLFSSGDQVYVAVGGGFTNVAPTGSGNKIQFLGNVEKSDANGSGVINMMGEARALPNITSHYVWLGDNNGVPQAVSSASLVVDNAVTASHALIADDLVSSATINITSITASAASFVSASITNLTTITGSIVQIGDAFVLLNTDTPTSRYAGIKVQDSGSAPTDYTASFQFDSQTNDWFYEYSGSDPTNFGVALFGPEYGTKGSPTYNTSQSLVKSNGGHHLVDSIVSDNGSTVTVAGDLTANVITANTNFAGDLVGTADTASYVAAANIDGNVTNATSASIASSVGLLSQSLELSGSFYQIGDNFFSNTIAAQIASKDMSQTGDSNIGNTSISSKNGTVSGEGSVIIATDTSTATGNRVITGAGYDLQNGGYWSVNFGGLQNYMNSSLSATMGGLYNNVANGRALVNLGGEGNILRTADSAGNSGMVLNSVYSVIGDGNNTGDAKRVAILNASASLIDHNLVSGSIIINGLGVTASLSDTIYLGTSTIVSGSVSGEVTALTIASQTASLDMRDGNFFTLTLVSGSDTHIDATNIQPGQTINVKLTQPGSGYGTVSFSGDWAFQSGSLYTGSAAAGIIDVVSAVTFDSSKLYANQVENLV